MICEFCEGQTVKKHHWLHGKLYITGFVTAKLHTFFQQNIHYN